MPLGNCRGSVCQRPWLGGKSFRYWQILLLIVVAGLRVPPPPPPPAPTPATAPPPAPQWTSPRATSTPALTGPPQIPYYGPVDCETRNKRKTKDSVKGLFRLLAMDTISDNNLGPLKAGQTVAIIGGGPAGSSCAIMLRR